MRVLDGSWFLPSMGRDAKALYAERRIPSAIFFDIDDIADHSTDLPHMLPSVEMFSSRMRKMGVGDGSRIIVYDNAGLFSAARVWWTFRAMGHDDVAVLDGGFPAWEAAGYRIETGPPVARTERHFTAQLRSDLVSDLAQVRRASERGSHTLLDARPAARFRGEAAEPRPGVRSGHIPGGRSTPSSDLVDAKGFLKSREELTALFDGTGADLRKPIMCSCGSGVTAAMIALALARLGRWDASVYDGSWAEWGSRSDTPIATGPA